MTNLIRAHFARLWRSPVFWLGTAASAAVAAVMTCLCMLVHKRAVLAWRWCFWSWAAS